MASAPGSASGPLWGFSGNPCCGGLGNRSPMRVTGSVTDGSLKVSVQWRLVGAVGLSQSCPCTAFHGTF